ncbi:hypothetical protein AB1N83_012605 [Pleurotus pulmonarius]
MMRWQRGSSQGTIGGGTRRSPAGELKDSQKRDHWAALICTAALILRTAPTSYFSGPYSKNLQPPSIHSSKGSPERITCLDVALVQQNSFGHKDFLRTCGALVRLMANHPYIRGLRNSMRMLLDQSQNVERCNSTQCPNVALTNCVSSEALRRRRITQRKIV